MSERPACCCPVCELEYALLAEINHPNSEIKYKNFSSHSQLLSRFPTCNALLSQLRQFQTLDNHASSSDEILSELLRVSRDPGQEIGRHLVLLILMPAIHKTSSQIAFGFPSLTRDDIVQHLLTSVLDILNSQSCVQTSHFAF